MRRLFGGQPPPLKRIKVTKVIPGRLLVCLGTPEQQKQRYAAPKSTKKKEERKKKKKAIKSSTTDVCLL